MPFKTSGKPPEYDQEDVDDGQGYERGATILLSSWSENRKSN